MGQLLFGAATHAVAQANIDAARLTRDSGNEKRGAQTALSQFSASLSNMRKMDAAADQVENIAENTARNLDAASVGLFQSRIAAAEELGATAAHASAAGVGGSTVENYNATVRITEAMKEEGHLRALNSDTLAAGEAVGNVVSNAVATFDNNVYRADLDLRKYVDHKKPSFFEQTVGIAATAAATVFGGPQAGAAVMGLFEARQSAQNGDYASASQGLTGAVRNGIGAAQSLRATGGPSGRSTTHGDVTVGDVDGESASWSSTQGIVATPEKYPNHMGSSRNFFRDAANPGLTSLFLH